MHPNLISANRAFACSVIDTDPVCRHIWYSYCGIPGWKIAWKKLNRLPGRRGGDKSGGQKA
jgi:hypothetical protein